MSWVHKFTAKEWRGTNVVHATFREIALSEDGLSITKSLDFSRETYNLDFCERLISHQPIQKYFLKKRKSLCGPPSCRLTAQLVFNLHHGASGLCKSITTGWQSTRYYLCKGRRAVSIKCPWAHLLIFMAKWREKKGKLRQWSQKYCVTTRI